MAEKNSNDRSPAGQVVAEVIQDFERGYLEAEGAARQALARLRRAVPGDIARSPETWPYVFSKLASPSYGPSNLSDVNGSTDVERAVHASLVLWAQHQQSQAHPVNAAGVSLGQAAGILSSHLKREGEPVDAGVLRRFTRLTSGNTFEERMRSLVQLVSLFRANEIALDYPRLAYDLVGLQRPEKRQLVLVRWARDLHRAPSSSFTEDATPAHNKE